MANLIVLRRRLRSAAQIAPRIIPMIRRQRPKPLVQFTSSTPELPTTLLPAVSSSATATIETPSPPIKTKPKPKKAHLGSQRTSRKAAKDVLLLTLEALSQSSDVFPPLKSVVGGLLFFTTQIELVSSNNEQVAEIYDQIDAFAESLVRAIPDVTMLSPIHETAIQALADDVNAVCTEMKAIERQRFFPRFLRAQRQSAQLLRLAKRLDQARSSFTMTLIIDVGVKTSVVLASLQPRREDIRRHSRTASDFFLGWTRTA